MRMAQTGPTLILDIDSASLGMCVLTEIDGRPIVSMTKRVPIGTGATRDHAALILLLKDVLATLLLEYAKVNPTTVIIVSASPWFLATLKTISSVSERPVRISGKTIDRVVVEHGRDATAEYIESVPIAVTVNGYRTRVIHPLLGKSLAVSMYQSVADSQFKHMVTTVIHASFSHARLVWHTTPLVYAETILRITGEDHAVIVDVGGEVTDITILSHKTVGFVGSLPHGSRSVIRSVATALNVANGAVADASSRLAMLASGELADADMQKVSTALMEASTDWQKGFNEILAAAGNSVPVSHSIFLIGERAELPWFVRVVVGAAVRAKLAPVVIGVDFFKGLLSYGEGGMFDSSLALAVLFFHMRPHAHSTLAFTPRVLYSV